MPGATVLAYYKEGPTFYLVSGYESNYPEVIKIPAGTPSDDAFAQQDVLWQKDTTKQFAIDRESTPELHGYYSIRTKVDDKFGFPKGGSKEKETPIDAAKREFGQEIGYWDLKDYKLKELSTSVPTANKAKEEAPNAANKSEYTIFTYRITSQPEIGAINKSIAAMKEARKGELFDVAFRSIEDIKKMPLNSKSKKALYAFEKNIRQMGGTRKRKRAKRQTLK